MGIYPYEIGSRIKTQRKKLHHTQEEFAEILSIGRVHLANIEAGRKMASLDLLVSISETLNCSLDYLVFGRTVQDNAFKDNLLQAISLLQAACDKLK